MTDSTKHAELRIFLGYIGTVFKPGASIPSYPSGEPDTAPVKPDFAEWSDEELDVFLEESRRAADQQQTDKRDVRSRAQVLLTTALVLGGAIAADFASHHCHHWWNWLASTVAFLCVIISALAATGILTAQSPMGVPRLSEVERGKSDAAKRTVARGYSETRHIGDETVAVTVTALRDSTLALVTSFLLAVIAHLVP